MMKAFRITNKMLVEGELASRDLSKKAKAYYDGTDAVHIIVLHPDDEYFPMYGLTDSKSIATELNTDIFDSFFELEATLEAWQTDAVKDTYWTAESFGNHPAPANADEVIAEANRLIDEGADSESLFESFCETDRVGSVIAVWNN